MLIRLHVRLRAALWLAVVWLGVCMAPAFAAPVNDSVTAPLLPHVAERLATHQPLLIIAFGSSSTEGVGASSPAATYPARLQALLAAAMPDDEAVAVRNRGIGGEDADDMLQRLPRILDEHPDLVIWQTGSNDPLRDVPLDRFIDETKTGIRLIQAAGADVMLMEPQLCRVLAAHGDAIAYRDAVRSVAAETGVPVVRRFDLMRAWLASGVLTTEQMLSPDGLHMADAGYAKLAEAVAHMILRHTVPPRVAAVSSSQAR